ncbi:hypothetical protein J2X20_003758 [Pelomonas saccharophila]|uniref:NTF2 fold immunity protein domain-containing protein n=1 Tax=Roseateles saccharophilus TaxID=304 RepID=A0ABU1YS73_ROSSA|nr:hypothetical protein [Roseateles saccharophilus]MDR7271100.1 hypothetical protein [Roseateles saccharophilus]
MLEWLRRLGAPKTGPDYRRVDSRQKAEELCKRGELKKLLLLPMEFGGQDVPPNVVYVPAFAIELKTRLDLNTIRPMAEKGLVHKYTATPTYEGKSVIPTSIRISATDPGRFEGIVSIWGRALERDSEPASGDQASEQLVFRLSEVSVEGLGPEELIRAYIADYESWNTFANNASERESDAGLDMAESAYALLMAKYCPPGIQHQPIAFGSDSSHDNEREVVLSVEPMSDRCLVKTRHTQVIGTFAMAHDYEYHLKKIDQRWFLVSVLYVDQDGKYEGL